MRLSGPVALALTLAVLAALSRDGAAGQPEAGAMVAVGQSTGSLSLTNALGSGAILSVSGLAPGQSTGGQVLLTNTGTLAGSLSLESQGTTESPGLGGGLLSQRLELEVLDPAGAAVYRGPVAGLGTRQLAALGAGEARLYSFRATLPDGAEPLGPSSGDNAYQGASLTTAFRWTASAPEPPGDGGSQGGGGDGGSSSRGGSSAGGPARRDGPAAGSKLVLRVALIKRQPPLKRRRLVLWASCSQACSMSARTSVAKGGGRSKTARYARARANRRVKLTLQLPRLVARAASRRQGAQLRLTVKARAAGGSASFSRGVHLQRTRAAWSKAKR